MNVVIVLVSNMMAKRWQRTATDSVQGFGNEMVLKHVFRMLRKTEQKKKTHKKSIKDNFKTTNK